MFDMIKYAHFLADCLAEKQISQAEAMASLKEKLDEENLRIFTESEIKRVVEKTNLN